ncbi:MAG: amidohydrolase [Chloroflexi bacterium]|nr:amidohydrolase [Chloroflexota bacterium]
MRIDTHTHHYPMPYLDEIERHPSPACSVTRDPSGRRLVHYAGDYNIVADGHIDLEARLSEMERTGVDMGVLTLTTPGVHVEERTRGIQLAQIVNDSYGEVQKQYPDRFVCLATLPLQDPAASAIELERAVTKLGLRGAMLFANVNGKPIHHKAYWPIYETAERLNVPLMIHPTSPPGVEAFQEYRTTALVGFLLDTTLCITLLMFEGVMEKYPKIKFMLSHLGGTIPYIAERIDRGYDAYPEVRVNLSQQPSFYFKRNCYYDTVAFEPRALQFAIEFAGADHMTLGSDYPHQIGDMEKSVKVIENLPIDNAVRERIFGGTASQLLRMVPRV